MREIDRIIRDTLSEEDSEMFDRFGGDQPIHESITDLFRFRPRWLLFGTIIVTFIAMAIAFYSVLQFYNALEIREMLMWGGVGFVSLLAVTTIKIWAWMEMSKNAILRDMKRLELQIVLLARKFNNSQT